MASIRKRINTDKTISYTVEIRKKGINLTKTFITYENAKLYEFYKENIIECMENFNIPLNERVTLRQICELKENVMQDRRTKCEITNSFDKIEKLLPQKKFVHEFTYEDWLQAAKGLSNVPVYKGYENENNKRLPTISSIRRWMANISSAFSYAISQGINIENHPLKVVQSYINPRM